MRTHNTVSPQITRAAGTLDDARDELHRMLYEDKVSGR